MINLSFEQAVGFYVLIFIFLFTGSIAFSLFRKKKKMLAGEVKFWQCSICAFVYSSVFDENITVCPQCGSYNKKEVNP